MIFDRIIRAATPENPRFSLNDPQAWDLVYGGQPAASGVRVTREIALSYAPWWRGTNLLAGDCGKLPLNVCQLVNETHRIDKSHPAWRPLRRKPNEYMTAFTLKEVVTGHAITQGNGYAYVDRDGAGRVLALLVLDPNDVEPFRDQAGRLWYKVQLTGLEPRKVPAEDMLHIRGFSPDGIRGYSVFDLARESIGLGVGARKYGSVFLRNNARPNIAIKTPQRLDEKQMQDLRKGWESLQGGLENAHKVAILQGQAELVEFSINARDAQLLETRQFEVREIALWMGVPTHKLGDASKAAYNSLEQENQDYLDTGLDPWLVRWEEECRAKLLTEEEKDQETHDVLFDRKRLIRADMNARSAYFQKATGGRAWMTPDEVRGEEGMEPQGGDAGDLKDPLNMGAAPPPGEPPPQKREKKDKGAKRAAKRAVLVDAMARMTRRLGHAARAAAKKPAQFVASIDALAGEHREVLLESLAPACRLFGIEPAVTADRLLSFVTRKLIDAAGETTSAHLADKIEETMTSLEAGLPAMLFAHLLGENQ